MAPDTGVELDRGALKRCHQRHLVQEHASFFSQ
jgi:hypothetical protein